MSFIFNYFARKIVLRAERLNILSKNSILLFIDLVAFAFSISAVFVFSGQTEILDITSVIIYLLVPAAVALISGYAFSFYQHNLRNSSSEILISGIFCSVSGTLSLAITDKYFGHYFSITELLLIFFIFLSGLMFVRLSWKTLHKSYHSHGRRNIMIFGAGSAGVQLSNSLRSNHQFNVYGFIDDSPNYRKTLITGKRIYTFEEFSKIVHLAKISLVFVAEPNITLKSRKEILEKLADLQVQVKVLPDFKKILDNNFDIRSFRKLKLKDLVGRDEIKPFNNLLTVNISKKQVMVTGGGGSIGSELCRQILKQNPNKLFILDNSENNLFEIYEELFKIKEKSRLNSTLVPILTSIDNKRRLNEIFETHNIETVFHAAAFKHVPMVEINKFDAISNNIFGTQALLEIASEFKVKTFVLISSDKAVRPTNIMGATKRICELIAFEIANRFTDMKVCAVRFGNVMGSSGSVIPIFEKQIESGGPITLTHKDITRYFMTIQEAAGLVIQSSGLCQNSNEIFLLDMGKPVKILDLAIKMVKLNGMIASFDNSERSGIRGSGIELKITGLRPGEKLYEELLVSHQSSSTIHPRINFEIQDKINEKKFKDLLMKLSASIKNHDHTEVYEILKKFNIGFEPNTELISEKYQ